MKRNKNSFQINSIESNERKRFQSVMLMHTYKRTEKKNEFPFYKLLFGADRHLFLINGKQAALKKKEEIMAKMAIKNK